MTSEVGTARPARRPRAQNRPGEGCQCAEEGRHDGAWREAGRSKGVPPGVATSRRSARRGGVLLEQTIIIRRRPSFRSSPGSGPDRPRRTRVRPRWLEPDSSRRGTTSEMRLTGRQEDGPREGPRRALTRSPVFAVAPTVRNRCRGRTRAASRPLRRARPPKCPGWPSTRCSGHPDQSWRPASWAASFQVPVRTGRRPCRARRGDRRIVAPDSWATTHTRNGLRRDRWSRRPTSTAR